MAAPTIEETLTVPCNINGLGNTLYQIRLNSTDTTTYLEDAIAALADHYIVIIGIQSADNNNALLGIRNGDETGLMKIINNYSSQTLQADKRLYFIGKLNTSVDIALLGGGGSDVEPLWISYVYVKTLDIRL